MDRRDKTQHKSLEKKTKPTNKTRGEKKRKRRRGKAIPLNDGGN